MEDSRRAMMVHGVTIGGTRDGLCDSINGAWRWSVWSGKRYASGCLYDSRLYVIASV